MRIRDGLTGPQGSGGAKEKGAAPSFWPAPLLCLPEAIGRLFLDKTDLHEALSAVAFDQQQHAGPTGIERLGH